MKGSNSESRVRNRDRFKSFARSTSNVLKQEFNKYYSSSSSSLPRGMTVDSSEPKSTQVHRSETEEIDDILTDNVPEIVQPQCMLFPTYACQVQDDAWKITLAGWAFAKPGSSRLDRFLLAAGRSWGGISRDSAQDDQWSTLLNQFRATTMKMTEIQLTLPGIIANKIIDDHSDHLTLDNQEKIRDFAASVNTGPSGRFEKEVLLDTASIKELKEKSKYLTVEASFSSTDEPPFPGYIDIIDPYGISIISDIDDTIKITDILDGKDAIIQNTFFRTAREVPHMSEVYRQWSAEGAHVHYVSNGPWQVYPAISEFIVNERFPQGSMHLRAVSAQDLIIGKPGKHKLEVIPQIIKDFPHRKFILVGDTGEIDPEIYQQIYNQYPDQIIKIFIHDVSTQHAIDADRVARESPESYFTSIKKFISKEGTMLKKDVSSSHIAMDAMAQTEVPEEQQHITDPDIPLMTKLEQLEDRMKRVSAGMREGVFTKFTLATQLLTDPTVAEEFLAAKSHPTDPIAQNNHIAPNAQAEPIVPAAPIATSVSDLL